MNSYAKTLSVFTFTCLFTGLLSSAEALSTNQLRASLDISTEYRGTDFSDDDALSIGPGAVGSLFSASLQGLNAAVGLDALIVENNLVIFSTDIGFTQAGTDYADEDLVAFNATNGTFSMYFDGSANGIDPRADLDAATLIPGTDVLLYSIDVSQTGLVTGITVTDEDVIRFASGTTTLFYDGSSSLGIPSSRDIDALHADGTHLYFSLDTTSDNSIIAGIGEDHHIWQFNTNSLSGTLITGMQFTVSSDISSLDGPSFSDTDALSDYEEITGIDDPATTLGGTSIALNPEGSTSNPLNPDSDMDGIDDGQEAGAGTDPLDDDSLLRITQIQRVNGTNWVTWDSVTNRTYKLSSTDTATPGTYPGTIEGGIAPTATSTTFGHSISGETQRFYSVEIDFTP